MRASPTERRRTVTINGQSLTLTEDPDFVNAALAEMERTGGRQALLRYAGDDERWVAIWSHVPTESGWALVHRRGRWTIERKRGGVGSFALVTDNEDDARAMFAAWKLWSAYGTPDGTIPTLGSVLRAVEEAPKSYRDLSVLAARERVRADYCKLLLGTARVLESVVAREPDPGKAVAQLPGAVRAAHVAPDAAPDYRGLTVAAYYDAVWAPMRKRETKGWRAQESRWVLHILPKWGQVKVQDLTGPEIHTWIEALEVPDRRTGELRLASGNYRRLIRSDLLGMTRYAESRGHVAEGAAPTVYRLKGSTETTWTKDALTREQFAALLDATGPMHKALFALGGIAGLRPAELCRARWEDLSHERKTLTVRGTKTSGSRATVRIFSSYDAIAAWWVLCGRPIAGPMFPRGVPDRPGAYSYTYDPHAEPIDAYKSALKAAARRAGIEHRVTPYTLRHTCATLAIEGGATAREVAAQLRNTEEAVLRAYDLSSPAKVVSERFGAWADEAPAHNVRTLRK